MKDIFTKDFIKSITKIVDWFEADSFLPFVDANNGVTILLIAITVGVIALCVSKRLRKVFF